MKNLPPGYKEQPVPDYLNERCWQHYDMYRMKFEDGHVTIRPGNGITSAIMNALGDTAAYHPHMPEDSIDMYRMHGEIIEAELFRRREGYYK